MKKFIAILLSLVLVFVLVACQGGGSDDKAKVDVFFYTFNDTYLTSVRNTLTEKLDAMADKVSYNIVDCENDQATQTEAIQTALTQGTDLLIVNIVTTGSEETAQAICDMAKENDVPIVFFNREVSDDVVRSYEKCAFVGTDPDEAGYMQGQMIAEYLLAEGNAAKYDLNGDGKINYIMLRGEHGNNEAFGRTKYSVEEANRLLAGALTLTPSPANQTSTQYEDDGVSNYFLYANWSATEAANLMGTALSSYALDNGDIEMIIANNDDAALGALEALNERGYNTGAEGQIGYIPVFGVDATVNARTAMDEGRMTGSILQDGPGMADGLIALLNNVLNGEALFANTSGFNVDEGVNKIRIPYAIVA